MNKVFIIGNLTANPTASTFDSGNTACRFTVAVNRRGKEGENAVDFLQVVAWNALAENCLKYIVKGSKVAVVGRIQTGSYEKDGVRRQTFDIVAEQVEFLSRRDTAETPKRQSIDELEELPDDNDDMPF